HKALNHVDVIDRTALSAVDLSFPVPEAVGVQVVDCVTWFSTFVLLTPNDITHGRLLLDVGLFIPFFNLGQWNTEQITVDLLIVRTQRTPVPVSPSGGLFHQPG